MNANSSQKSSLLVPSKQLSNFTRNLKLSDYYDQSDHQFIRLLCVQCGHDIVVPVYCGYRFCDICGLARQSRVRSRLKFLLANIRDEDHYGTKHLTLTIPNMSSLDGMVRRITKAFRKLRSRAYWKNHVLGGAFVLEITGRPGNWHVHIHAIIQAKYMTWNTLHKLWLKVSGGRGVYIQKIPRKQCILYLTKYLSKSGMPGQVMIAMSDALKGARLFSPFGTWYAVSKLYVRPVCLCSECKTGTFELYDQIVYGKFRGSFALDSG